MVKHYKKYLLALVLGTCVQTLSLAQTDDKIYYYNGKPVKAATPQHQETLKPNTEELTNTQAQSEQSYSEDIPQQPVQSTLTIRPFSFIKSKFVLGYEQAVAPRKSLSLYAGITAADYSDFYSAFDVLGFDFQGQYRFYVQPNKQGLSGLYAGPYAFYKTIKMDLNSNNFPSDPTYLKEFEGNSGGFGVLIGYQLVIKNTAVIDVFTGGGLRFSSDNLNNQETYSEIKEYTESGIYPNISLQVGFAL